jgi:hypothetical protein
MGTEEGREVPAPDNHATPATYEEVSPCRLPTADGHPEPLGNGETAASAPVNMHPAVRAGHWVCVCTSLSECTRVHTQGGGAWGCGAYAHRPLWLSQSRRPAAAHLYSLQACNGASTPAEQEGAGGEGGPVDGDDEGERAGVEALLGRGNGAPTLSPLALHGSVQ